MNTDRFIPGKWRWESDAAKFWVKNHTVEERFEDYLHATGLHEQDINYSKKLKYEKELTNILGIRGNGKVLPYNMDSKRNITPTEWPVRARTTPVNKARLAALDLPNIRTDICCNVLDWSSSNHIIAALGKITYMWHVPSSTMTKCIKAHYDITALQMNVDSTILAFAGEELNECEIKLLYAESSKILQITDPVDCHHKNCYVTCIEYHPSNKYLILGCRKGYIVVKTASDMINVSAAKNAHNSRDVIRIKCSPDGRYVASSGFDGFVHIWGFPRLELVCSHQEPFCSKGISWHPWKYSYLCIGTTNGSLTLINACTGKVIAQKKDDRSLIYNVTFNKLSGELVTSQSVCPRGSSAMTFQSQINVLSSFDRVVDRFEGHCRKVLFLEWSPDNRILASAGTDETIHFWKFFGDTVENPKKTLKPASVLNLEQFIR